MVEGASLTLPETGRTIRYGPDEQLDVPSSVSWDTQVPGGFGPGQMTVPRPANLHKDTLLLYADVRIYGPGNRTLYEGYVTGVPQSGEDFVTLQFAGHATLLERFATFRAIVVDRDLNRWTDVAAQRHYNILDDGIFNSVAGPSSEWATDTQALALELPPETNPCAVAYYDAGAGPGIARIDYAFRSVNTSSNHIATVAVANNEIASSTEATSDLITSTDASGSGSLTPTARHRYAQLFFGTVGTPTDNQILQFTDLAVWGAHDIPRAGHGVIATDVIKFILQGTPLIPGDIDQTTTVIPHLAWPEPVTRQQAIEDTTAFGGSRFLQNIWGVYENREFFWRPPGTGGRTWRVERDMADPASDGPDVDQRVAGIQVAFQDVTGKNWTVGPPGSGSDHETNDLLDSDRDNPAHRIPGMFQRVEIGTMPMIDGQPTPAINCGIVLLNTRNRLSWRGTIPITGHVEDEHGNPAPAALIRAGDRIVIDGETLPVTSTQYQDDTEQNTVAVGARPDEFEDLVARLAAVTGLTLG